MIKYDQSLNIRPVREEDLAALWKLVYEDESPEWKKWDAPYFEHKKINFEEFLKKKDNYLDQDDFQVIVEENQIIGSVSYYWEDKTSKWLEMGIVIYRPEYWGGGRGTQILHRWISHLFKTLPLVRVGYTTWSGNQRMIAVGEKLGMTMEARLRKCRYYDGKYYDSIRMGLLREEWEMDPVFIE